MKFTIDLNGDVWAQIEASHKKITKKPWYKRLVSWF